MIRNLNFLFVTFFGIGTIRYAPGTITSLITTVFLFNLFYVLNLSETNILVVLVVIFFSSFPAVENYIKDKSCLLYTSPSPRDAHESRMPSSA